RVERLRGPARSEGRVRGLGCGCRCRAAPARARAGCDGAGAIRARAPSAPRDSRRRAAARRRRARTRTHRGGRVGGREPGPAVHRGCGAVLLRVPRQVRRLLRRLHPRSICGRGGARSLARARSAGLRRRRDRSWPGARHDRRGLSGAQAQAGEPRRRRRGRRGGVHRALRRARGQARGRPVGRGPLGREETVIRSTWLRVVIAATATVVAAVVGVLAVGVFEPSPNPDQLPPGANLFMFLLAAALVVGFVAYAAIEWLQTRRFESITRQFDTRTIVLIPLAIAINVVLGQTVASALKVPLYLDSIGTILVGVLAGPFAGAATGLLSNLAWTFLFAGTPFGSPFAWPFAIVAAEIGLLAGLFGYAGVFRSRPNTPPAKLLAGIVVAIVLLGALVWYGILPHYAKLCAGQPGSGGSVTSGCLDLFQPIGSIDPVFLVVAVAFL